MHFDASPPASGPTSGPWYKELTSYHWFVLVVAALGWMFDTMDQQLFNLARKPAIHELLKGPSGYASPGVEAEYGGYATMIFMVGWATGGLFFGVLGDRIGRAKTMLITILAYSAFTGLSALSFGVWDFAFYRFLTGLGVGGEFAVGVALVAEVIPDRARPYALGWVQAMSAVGNMTAALISMGLGRLEQTGAVGSSWRWMFVIGMAPALLAVLIRRRLREPEKWKAATRATDGLAAPESRAGSIAELFGTPRWRYNAIVGMILGFSGVVGLWGIGFFSFDLIRPVFRADMIARGVAPATIEGRLTYLVGLTSLMQNLGGFFGVYAFTRVTAIVGRRVAFAISFLLAMAATAGTFRFINSYDDLFWMIPLMGFSQMTLFGGYAIYFPELFPTRLRSTGASFCYNVGRFVAAIGPLFLGLLTSQLYMKTLGFDEILSRRYSGVTMCAVFLIGLCAVPFAPETKGKPLPE
jgi:MFS family permease